MQLIRGLIQFGRKVVLSQWGGSPGAHFAQPGAQRVKKAGAISLETEKELFGISRSKISLSPEGMNGRL
jgi:hypothetical protein